MCIQYLEVVSYLFSLTIFIVNIGQDKINPAHSVTEEHRVFTVLLFVNLQRDQTEVTRFKRTRIHSYRINSTSLWMHSAQQTRQSNYSMCQKLAAKPPHHITLDCLFETTKIQNIIRSLQTQTAC